MIKEIIYIFLKYAKIKAMKEYEIVSILSRMFEYTFLDIYTIHVWISLKIGCGHVARDILLTPSFNCTGAMLYK